METSAPPQETKTYQGSCHCGRVRFRVTGNLADTVDCNCSMCTKKGFLHLIVAPDAFQLLQGDDALTTYRFNTMVAKHTFCRHCGVHPTLLRPRPFDGRNWEATMAARRAEPAA